MQDVIRKTIALRNTCFTHLGYLVRPLHEPIDRAAVDDGWKHAKPRPEGLSKGGHAEHDVDIRPHTVDILSPSDGQGV